MLGDLFYHLGTAVGGLGSHLPGKAGAATGTAGPDTAETAPDTPASADPAPEDSLGHTGGLVASAAAAWLLARVLKPRPVSWPRVIVAGVAATFLADLVARTLYSDDAADRRAAPGDPEAIIQRYGRGVALAAGYASLLYPRLPGPPLLRGLAFGAIELAATPHGGLAGLAADTPTLRFPLQALARPTEEDPGPLAPLAFGLGLGLLYTHEPHDDE